MQIGYRQNEYNIFLYNNLYSCQKWYGKFAYKCTTKKKPIYLFPKRNKRGKNTADIK